MDDLGYADITGFVCKKSTFENHKEDIVSVIKIWFDSVRYVLSDIDTNSKNSLDYLNPNYAIEIKNYTLSLQSSGIH